MACIDIRNLSKIFGKTVAVDCIELNVAQGEFLALLGPSGCGKTTTLRMVAGLEKPTTGQIYFDNTLLNNMPTRDRNVSMVFERYALYPHLKVYDNIATPLKIRRFPKEEIQRRVKVFSEILEISDRLTHYPSQLSGGQRQRVGIARALVREPSVFLLDEPISHLDAKLRTRMRAELKRLQKKMGITTLYVTHDQVEAMTMADRISVMSAGKIQQIGMPEELYSNPANLFVARFIGEPTINVLPIHLTKRDQQTFFEEEELKYLLSQPLAEKIKQKNTSKELFLAFRPQHSHLASKPGKEGEFSVPATITLIEPLGTEQIVHLSFGKYELRWIGPADLRVGLDETCHIVCSEEKLILFDRENEINIMN